MKRNLLFTVLLVLSSIFAFGQISITPEELILSANGEESIYFDIEINNEGADTELYWRVEPSDDFPSNWTGQVCDINLCYGWGSYQSSPSAPNAIGEGETIKFSLKVRDIASEPMNGSSYMILKLYDDPEFTNEVGSTSAPKTSTNNIDVSNTVLFPNPTSDAFQIKNDASISQIKIYNIVGREILAINHTQGTAHDISDLRTGMYLVRLEDKNGKVVKAMRLSKR